MRSLALDSGVFSIPGKKKSGAGATTGSTGVGKALSKEDTNGRADNDYLIERCRLVVAQGIAEEKGGEKGSKIDGGHQYTPGFS